MRGRLRKRLSPVCGVVDGSAAICSSSPPDSLLKSLFGAVLPPPMLADVFSPSFGELLASADCSADGAGVFESGDNRPRGDSN